MTESEESKVDKVFKIEIDKTFEEHDFLQCHICNKRFDQNNFEVHLANHHPSIDTDNIEEGVVCEYCEKCFMTNTN